MARALDQLDPDLAILELNRQRSTKMFLALAALVVIVAGGFAIVALAYSGEPDAATPPTHQQP